MNTTVITVFSIIITGICDDKNNIPTTKSTFMYYLIWTHFLIEITFKIFSLDYVLPLDSRLFLIFVKNAQIPKINVLTVYYVNLSITWATDFYKILLLILLQWRDNPNWIFTVLLELYQSVSISLPVNYMIYFCFC